MAEAVAKRAREDEAAASSSSSSSSSSSTSFSSSSSSSLSSSSASSSSSSRAARASRRATGVPAQFAPPRARRRTAAERARLADLFLDVIGVVVEHNRGQFAHECWQCQYLCRKTRYVAGVTRPGSLAEMVFHGCRPGGVTKLLEEARTCKRIKEGLTQLRRAARVNDVERVRQLVRLGCPTAVVNAWSEFGLAALHWACSHGYEAVVCELLAHGADVNIKALHGWTPLMHAEVAAFLRSRGAPE